MALRRLSTRAPLLCAGGAAGLILALGAAAGEAPAPAPRGEALNPSVQQQVVEPGDTLWSLCDKVTGKPWLWPQVWAMNPEITNPHWIYAGDVVRFVPSGESGPSQAEMVASNVDLPEGQADAGDGATSGPRVEVINTAPRPSRQRLQVTQRVFDGMFVTPDELQAAGRLANAVPDKMLLRPGDLVLMTFPHGAVPKADERFYTYRTVRPVAHPATHERWGFMTEITGVATVLQVQGDVARARLDSAVREVERGQYVTPMRQDLLLTVGAPTPSKAPLTGVILAVEGDRVTVGEQRLVFIDKGANDGVERGNRFKVRSSGDPLTAFDTEVAEIDTATLLVVDAKPTASTCLVLEAAGEVWTGDPVHTDSQPL